MFKRTLLSLFVAGLYIVLAALTRGGSPTDATADTAPPPAVDLAFQKGSTELQLESGFELSLQHTHLRLTNFD